MEVVIENDRKWGGWWFLKPPKGYESLSFLMVFCRGRGSGGSKIGGFWGKKSISDQKSVKFEKVEKTLKKSVVLNGKSHSFISLIKMTKKGHFRLTLKYAKFGWGGRPCDTWTLTRPPRVARGGGGGSRILHPPKKAFKPFIFRSTTTIKKRIVSIVKTTPPPLIDFSFRCEKSLLNFFSFLWLENV